MAELVDALGSGPSRGNPVEVRVLFRAFLVCNSEELFRSHLTVKGLRAPARRLAREGCSRPRAEIGRQAGLRDQCQKWRTGSSPVVGMGPLRRRGTRS